MAISYTRIFLDSSDRLKRIETDKTYAIRFYRDWIHVPKSQCILHKLESYDPTKIGNNPEYALDISDWLINKNEDINDLITDYANRYKKTTDS